MGDSRLVRHEIGFLQIADMPDAKDLGEYYASSYYQQERGNYALTYSSLETNLRNLKSNRLIEKALSLKGMEMAPGGRFLDVGCGEGFMLAEMAGRGWEVRGLDFSRAGVTAMNPEVTPFVDSGDLFTLLDQAIASDETYDLVWMFHVLEHVVDPVGLLERLRTVLAPGGSLVVSVPNDGSDFHEQLFEEKMIERRWWIAPPDHLSYFTIENLVKLFESTGFTVRSVEGSFPVDWFLANPQSNYVDDPEKGSHAFSAQCMLELLIEKSGKENASLFYESLAGIGMGRDLVVWMS